MPTKRRAASRTRKRSASPVSRRLVASKSPPKPRFVGRDPSPVLDRYPPKDPGIGSRAPVRSAPPAPKPSAPPASPAPAQGPTDAPPASPPSLIALERPFDVDDFSQSLGENLIRVTVPREDLGEVLRRVTDFMGFGIYVYRFSVRPAPSDQLKQFVVELERVDFSPEARDWVQFEEKGRSESPFGPGSTR